MKTDRTSATRDAPPGPGAGGAFRILVINPGSTSTKLSVFEDDREVARREVPHSRTDLAQFATVVDQKAWRLEIVRRFLDESRAEPSALHAVAGRGGLLHPVESGTYVVTEAMLDDLRTSRYGSHASNLGGLLAHEIAQAAGCRAYVVDPVVVDELDEVARLSGIPEIERRSLFHALNQKSAAREVARRMGRSYDACNFIVAHMGGGISVGAHRKGRVVDTNNALDGDGPFSPERSGGLPAGQVVDLCFGGELSRDAMRRRIVGEGGLVAYRQSSSLVELRTAGESGDRQATTLYDAMAYQVSQEIAKHGATLEGEVDAVVLTGGLSHDGAFVDRIRKRVGYLGPVEVVPGEREMISLADGVLSVLRGERKAKEYRP